MDGSSVILTGQQGRNEYIGINNRVADHASASARAREISWLISSRLISETPFFPACARRAAKARVAPSLVISDSGEEISNGILRCLTTALANTLIAVEVFMPNSWHSPSNCFFNDSSMRTLNVACAIITPPCIIFFIICNQVQLVDINELKRCKQTEKTENRPSVFHIA